MNRLVIIGNGFDLAHGLPTGYKHFIDNYWKDLNLINHEDNFIKLDSAVDYKQKGIINYSSFKALIEDFVREKYPTGTINSDADIKVHISISSPWKSILEFKNDFFKNINQKRIENWVDIENEYYDNLKQIVKSDYAGQTLKHKNDAVKKLNDEFYQVKILLEKYLIEKVEKLYDFSKLKGNDFFEIFETNMYEGMSLQRFYMELPKKDENQFENEFEKIKTREMLAGVKKDTLSKKKLNLKNYFLSFNYTSTVFEYNKQLHSNLINLNEIHGKLDDEKNPINFGFGDEMDDDYKIIENINDNDYLKNFKSFQYLHTSNYKRLLDLIDSDKFQVYIMGHSCGLSDRTLLNTIFEHENCCSIKIFYHQKEAGTDNYTEITQNISRHFNKKKLMREKIVNKTLCQPLPQIQLPKI